MQTHPVPQNITSYEFRLVGDMTLKQFMFLAVGIVIGIMLYKLPLPIIIRLPLAAIPIIGGILAAFVPINGRPFIVWVNAFFKAIYAPTVFEWAAPQAPKSAAELTQTTAVTPTKAPVLSFSSILTSSFAKKTPVPNVASGGVGPAPNPNPDPDKPILFVPEAAVPSSPQSGDAGGPTTTTSSVIKDISEIPQKAVARVIPAEQRDDTRVPPVPIPTDENPYLPTAKDKSTPRFQPITPDAPVVNAPVNAGAAARPTLPSAPPATLTSSIATPTVPNILTGLVVDTLQQSVGGATVEIIDAKTGIPTRALRTNRLGQFQIAIPLPAGSYTLQAEKEGLKFTPVSITINNAIIQPVVITATVQDAPPPNNQFNNNQISKY